MPKTQLFDREKLIVIIFCGYIFFCLPPYNSNLAIKNKTSGPKDFKLTRLTDHVIMHEGYSNC